MRYERIKNEFYKNNRQKYVSFCKENAISIFHSNDVFPTNADGTMKFKQNNDLFYLTGIDQAETILILFPDFVEKKYREILFIKETNDHIRVWEGQKLSREDASTISGIQTVLWENQFDTIFGRLINHANFAYLNTNQHASAAGLKTQSARFIFKFKNEYPLHHLERAAPILEKLRSVKAHEEQIQIKKAVDITDKMFGRAMIFLKPNVFEYEIEAEITHELLLNGARSHAFEPIVAAGKNACVLHYIDNDSVCKAGDLVLIDMGSEYGNYNADMTRTIPVSGKFTTRQKSVYQSVKNVMDFARKQMFVGNTFEKMNLAVNQKMEEELLKLNLLKANDVKISPFDSEKPALKKYFPHGVSHFLGLDVHDVGHRFMTFEAGMVLTNEPGIYIPEEGIGIRIENDILITETGNYDFMENVPVEIEEIEAIMAK